MKLRHCKIFFAQTRWLASRLSARKFLRAHISLRTMLLYRHRFLNMIILGLNLIVSYHIPGVGKMVFLRGLRLCALRVLPFYYPFVTEYPH